ncbi:hypothetical protein L596_027484 [Steinernema carpocapsae]|uniref:MAM domain-containing protein n=1 Tax=Steinernema carpocapsae TaxID=34508 RepID=A0A4U5LVK0_STECR|nr:hypothetical protein L596_027484 [Steinernema carpocapsae]
MNRTFMIDFELQMAALALNITIYVYSPNHTTKWLPYSPEIRIRQPPPYPDRRTCLMRLQDVHFDHIEYQQDWHAYAPKQTIRNGFAARQIDDYFLLAGGEENFLQSARLEVPIPCQLGKSEIKFDYWSNTGNPTLKACIVMDQYEKPNCAEFNLVENPLAFEVPQNLVPFVVRIEVDNLTPDDIVLIDNVNFSGQICELVPEDAVGAESEPNDDQESLPTTVTSFLSSTAGFGAHVHPLKPLDTVVHGSLQKSIVDDTAGPMVPKDVNAEVLFEDDEDILDNGGEVEICDSLQCNFNENDTCFYNPAGSGSTSDWLVGNGHLGNRHTGVRQNPNEPTNGGFLYVGRDRIDQSTEVFVFESIHFHLKESVVLVFDVYQRSYGPCLKVCLNTFDNCPYTNPPIRATEWWFRDQEVVLGKDTQKVLLYL